MLEQYKHSIHCTILGHGTGTVGNPRGVEPAVLTSLLNRMVIWVKLCQDAAQAEFPDFALTGCMYCLDVTSALALGAQVGGLDPEHLATATARLAAAFVLDEIQLRDQLSFWRPRALNLAKQHGLQTSQDAWQMLLQKEEKNSHTPYTYMA